MPHPALLTLPSCLSAYLQSDAEPSSADVGGEGEEEGGLKALKGLAGDKEEADTGTEAESSEEEEEAEEVRQGGWGRAGGTRGGPAGGLSCRAQPPLPALF